MLDHAPRPFDRRVLVTMTFSVLFAIETLVTAASCAGSNFGRLRIKCPHPDAALFVDGKYMGPVKVLADSDIHLPSGWHLVEIRQQGFYARYRRIRIQPNGVALLDVRLVPALDWALISRDRRGTETGKVTKR